jgi:sugar phosphate permease
MHSIVFDFVTKLFTGVGTLSDKIGRRKILLFGLLANAVCTLAFGFSVNM